MPIFVLWEQDSAGTENFTVHTRAVITVAGIHSRGMTERDLMAERMTERDFSAECMTLIIVS